MLPRLVKGSGSTSVLLLLGSEELNTASEVQHRSKSQHDPRAIYLRLNFHTALFSPKCPLNLQLCHVSLYETHLQWLLIITQRRR